MTTRKITETGIIAALYIVLSIFVQVPLADKISLDLGYVVLGTVAAIFAPWQCAFIAGLGAIAKCFSLTGTFPFAWFPANLILGYVLSIIAKKTDGWKRVVLSAVLVFTCIAGIKTFISYAMYRGGFIAILTPNIIASVADSICVLIGYLVAKHIRFVK